MNLEQYEFKAAPNYFEYDFFSVGPKGKIRKIVRFAPRMSNGISYYNLAFGDWNEAEQAIDDEVISDNSDMEIVLVTVAAIAIDFMQHFPGASIYVEGGSASRTRLYQMGISRLWGKIDPFLEVYGLTSLYIWELFQRNVPYQAFLVRHK